MRSEPLEGGHVLSADCERAKRRILAEEDHVMAVEVLLCAKMNSGGKEEAPRIYQFSLKLALLLERLATNMEGGEPKRGFCL